MAWTPIEEVEPGDYVNTPQGNGTVSKVSKAQGTAQVKIGTDTIEVPLKDVSPGGVNPQPDGEDGDFKPGDTVTVRGVATGKKRVVKVQERGVWAQPVTGGAMKRYRRDQLKLEQPASPPHVEPDRKPVDEPKKDEGVKIGDRVEVASQGEVYTSYFEEAERLGATKWETGNTAKNGDQGTVKNIGTGYHKIALVEKDNGTQFLIGTKGIKKTDEQPTKEQAKAEEDTVAQTGDGLGEILKLKEYMEKKIDDSVDSELKDLRDAVKANQKLEIKVGETTKVLKGKTHAQFETLVTYSALRLATLMVGMAGTGKTHAGEQVAEALGLPFYAMSVGAQTSKSDIIGYMDANGNYVKTFFRDAYERGGIFLMDEIDAGNANVLIQVNAALSNGLCAFPDEMVKKHPDFVFIASANTYGNGANRQYVGRNQLDAATLDRFAILDWKIDDTLEETLAVGQYGSAWYKTVRASRDFVADKGIRALISPRATQKGSQLLAAGIHVSEVINATLLGSVPEDKKADVIMVATRVYDGAAAGVPSKVAELIRPEPVKEVADFPF